MNGDSAPGDQTDQRELPPLVGDADRPSQERSGSAHTEPSADKDASANESSSAAANAESGVSHIESAGVLERPVHAESAADNETSLSETKPPSATSSAPVLPEPDANAEALLFTTSESRQLPNGVPRHPFDAEDGIIPSTENSGLGAGDTPFVSDSFFHAAPSSPIHASPKDPPRTSPTFSSAVDVRPSRKIPHRKSFKLKEAPSVAVDELDLEIRAAATVASPTRHATFAPMQVRPSAVAEFLPRRVFCSNDNSTRRDLPNPLPAPVALRCDFCIKFNSVCSNCHFKWKKEHLKRRTDALMSHIALQSESASIIVFLCSVARGNIDFIEAFLDAFPDALHWQGRFQVHEEFANPNLTPYLKLLNEAGRVHSLHIAAAWDRVDVAKLLLSRGATFRRSEKGHSPLDFLPKELPERWATMLRDVDAYRVHVLCEECKHLRQEQKWQEAENLYNEALSIMPSSEHALCGLAKMAYDAGRYQLCIQRCDDILGKAPGEIRWAQFMPSTVEMLRNKAFEKFHEESHPARGSVLRPCGCIILDYLRLSIRKLPFNIIRLHVFPFMDCTTAADLHRATRRMPLLNKTLADHAAALHPDVVRNWMVGTQAGRIGERLIDDMKRDLPTVDHVKWEPPVTWRTFEVFAVADFNAILVKTVVEVGNPNHRKKESVFSFAKKKDEPKFIQICKQVQLTRRKIDEPWSLHSVSEWEPC